MDDELKDSKKRFEDTSTDYKDLYLKTFEGEIKNYKKQYESEIKVMEQNVKNVDKKVKDQGKIVKNAKKASEKAKDDGALKSAWDFAVAEDTRLKNEKMKAELTVKEAKNYLKNFNDKMGK